MTATFGGLVEVASGDRFIEEEDVFLPAAVVDYDTDAPGDSDLLTVVGATFSIPTLTRGDLVVEGSLSSIVVNHDGTVEIASGTAPLPVGYPAILHVAEVVPAAIQSIGVSLPDSADPHAVATTAATITSFLKRIAQVTIG